MQFAQVNQDKLLLELIGQNGYFIDLAAKDAKEWSHTLALEMIPLLEVQHLRGMSILLHMMIQPRAHISRIADVWKGRLNRKGAIKKISTNASTIMLRKTSFTQYVSFCGRYSLYLYEHCYVCQ
jgi:hypothetical protein